jgi:replicative DNA helicase
LIRKPENLEAEKMVIAAAVLDSDCTADIIDIHFVDQRNEIIANALKSLFIDGGKIDLVTLNDMAGKQGHKIPQDYLLEIISDVTAPALFKHHLEIVKEVNEGRQVWDICQKAIGELGNGKRGITAQLIQDLVHVGHSALEYKDAQSLMLDADKYIEAAYKSYINQEDLPFGIPYGIYTIDQLTAGMQPQDLIIIAARPGEGKSAFAVELLLNISVNRKDKKTGLYVSLEMTNNQNAIRMIANRARIENIKLQTGRIDGSKLPEITDKINKIASGRFYLQDCVKNHVDNVCASILRAKAMYDIDYAIVDYMQLMFAEGSDTERVTRISNQIKNLARELNIPIIVPCQLNRARDRDLKRTSGDKIELPYPYLSDLRNSGAIEQDANVVMFVHHFYKYLNNPPDSIDGEILIAKNRGGPTGSVAMSFERPYLRFKIKG